MWLGKRLLRSLIGIFCLLGAGDAWAQPFGLSAVLDPEGLRLFPQPYVFLRHPGKPDPRWSTFDWKYTDITTPSGKYRLYFYQGEDWTAQYAMPAIQDQVGYLSHIFNYAPSQRFNYVLFSSERNFGQANVFEITEGVQGITSTSEATMAIPYWGEKETFRHISTHEMVHQFQVQKINDLSGNYGEATMSSAPLWFIEGMAEYYSLHGVDTESRFYIEDLLLHPDKKKDYTVPDFFENGALTFINVYKMGQAKIDFLETEFGPGTAQRVLEAVAREPRHGSDSFIELVGKTVAKAPAPATPPPMSKEEINKRWSAYLDRNFKAVASKRIQPLETFEVVKEAGENLDSYAINPSGDLLAIREITPLSGIVSINLIDEKDHQRKIEVIHDQEPGALSLYFMEEAGLVMTDQRIAYLVSTILGPEIEFRNLSRDPQGRLKLGDPYRISLHDHGMMQAASPTFSPDGESLAWVGVNEQGWQNVYVTSVSCIEKGNSPPCPIRQLTQGYYSYRDLDWVKEGILVASDRTPQAKYNIFRLDPTDSAHGALKQLTFSDSDQLEPEGDSGTFFFQSWQSGSSQIHFYDQGADKRLTDAQTLLKSPTVRQGKLYALGFRSGRFHLYRVPQGAVLSIPVAAAPEPTAATTGLWTASIASLPPSEVHDYRPFVSSGMRLDNLSGFFATGTVVGASASVSDLMRDHSLSADLAFLGELRFTDMDLFYGNYRGKTKWTTGLYHLFQPQLDSVFSTEGQVNTYLQREFGGLISAQYPLGAFSYVDLELRLAGVSRSDYSNPNYVAQWDAINPGTEFEAVPEFRLGYDRIVYEAFTGPLQGYGILLESDTSFYPGRHATSERARLDFSYYWEIVGRTILALEGLSGVSWGGTFNSPFFVSSDDILRAYSFGDSRLYGNYLAAAKSELRFPIGTFFGFPPLRGLVAYDLGSIFINSDQFSSGIASSASVGIGLNIPPVAISFVSSWPIRVAPGPEDRPVFHFTFRYLYL